MKQIIIFCTVIVFFCANNVLQAQNINNPNKQGPLGTQVNTYSGNFFFERTDLYIPARGFDLDLSFKYNSYNFDTENSYGKGWSFEYDIRYATDTLNGKVITWGNGREDTYALLAGGNYKAPRGFFSSFAQYQPNKYALTELDGTKYIFDNATHKRLTRMEEPNGNFINLTYTDSLLSSLTNAAGQTISFTYNQSGRLATLVDAITSPTRTFTYSYSNTGNLLEVTDPLGGKNKYSYLINGPMKTLSDKNSNVVNIIYFSDYSASEVIGCNKRISFSYDTTSLTTVVTDHLKTGNQVTTYKYQRLDNLAWITSMSGNCCGFNMTYEFDDNGNKIKETDANGNIYTYTYDQNGNVLTMTDPENQTSTYAYTSAFNNLISYKDPKGNIYALSYNATGNLTQLIAPGNLIYTASYSPNGDIISSTDPKGNIYSYNYDAYGNPTTVTGPNGYNAALGFDARGNLLSFTDALGNTHAAEYDILDRLKKITDPNNQLLRTNYDAEGNAISLISKNNETTLLNYDASNRLVKIKDPIGNTSEMAYDEMDNAIQMKNALGNGISFSYDTRNRLTASTDALGNRKINSYDNNGNIIKMEAPNGQSINYSYDKVNRVTQINDLNGSIATMAYDKNSNLISYTNGTGAVTTATYDSIDRLKTVTDPLGKTSILAYDKNNNVTSITDRNGNVESYSYDSINRVKSYTDNNGFVINIGYDVKGNIISAKDQNNNITSYTYDNLNRVKRTIYPNSTYLENSYDNKNNIIAQRLADGSSITYQYDSINRPIRKTLPSSVVYSYSYDALGRMTSATNDNGTVLLTYDKLNRITSETYDGRTTRYAYDIAGRTKTIIYPDSSVIIQGFDTRNRLVSVTKNSTTVANYQYNNANQNIVKTFANGVSSTMQYDIANRLSNISTSNGSIQNTNFSYDNEGNKTAINRINNPALSEQFVYDNGYRITNYKRGVAGSPTIQNSYIFDAVGNRVSANLNGTNTTYTANNLNQLINSNNGTQNLNFIYDGRGNLSYDGNFYKIYDAEGRLLKDSASPANVLSYKYDPFGRRIQKILNGSILKYSYSGLSQIEERDAANILLNSTVFTNFLSPVMNEKSGAAFYYHQNELGSVEAITGANGNIRERYQYDLYGKTSRFDSAGNILAGSITGNRVGFTGQEYDSATASYKFHFRNYSPVTGTFNQRDLIGYADGMGMYQYVGNNPANGVDILGLEDCGEDKKKDLRRYLDNYYEFTDLVGQLEKLGIKIPDNYKKTKWLAKNFTKLTELIAPYTDLAEMSLSLDGAAYSDGDAQTMHAGDAIKHGVKSALKFGGILSGLTGNAPGAAGAAGATKTIDLVDGGSKAYYDQTQTTKYDQETFEYERELEENLRRQGKDKLLQWLRTRERMEEKFLKWKKDNCPPPDGTRKNPPRGPSIIGPITYVQAHDPNLILGPVGEPAKAWVAAKDRLPYTVLYENDSTASAPAKYVKVVAPIKPKQDPATFQLGNFGFNNQTFSIPPNTASYYQRLDCRDSIGLFVDITAGYDQITNVAFWELQSIDPLTLLPPADPFKGFLFLQDTLQPNYGNGFVNFSIKPLQSSVTLDTIVADAIIIFDQNDTIATNQHKNTIDAFAPTSTMNSLPATSNNPVALSWGGADDLNGCGIRFYTLYISTDGINFSILKNEITRTDTSFSVAAGSNYYFFVLATDSVGNMEALRPGAVQTTFVGVVLNVSLLSFNGRTVGKDNVIEWSTTSEQNSKSFELERSFTGNDFRKISTLNAAGNSSSQRNYSYTDQRVDKLNSAVMFYRLKQIDNNNNFKYSNVVRLIYTDKDMIPSIVYPNPTQGIISIAFGNTKLIGTMAIISDANGRQLKQVKITANTQSFDLSSYTNGIYFIQLNNKEVLKVVKL